MGNKVYPSGSGRDARGCVRTVYVGREKRGRTKLGAAISVESVIQLVIGEYRRRRKSKGDQAS